MTKHRDYCLWEETAIDRDYAVHQAGEPIIICHHPQGKGFCDYWEETLENRSLFCPLFRNLSWRRLADDRGTKDCR